MGGFQPLATGRITKGAQFNRVAPSFTPRCFVGHRNEADDPHRLPVGNTERPEEVAVETIDAAMFRTPCRSQGDQCLVGHVALPRLLSLCFSGFSLSDTRLSLQEPGIQSLCHCRPALSIPSEGCGEARTTRKPVAGQKSHETGGTPRYRHAPRSTRTQSGAMARLKTKRRASRNNPLLHNGQSPQRSDFRCSRRMEGVCDVAGAGVGGAGVVAGDDFQACRGEGGQ